MNAKLMARSFILALGLVVAVCMIQPAQSTPPVGNPRAAVEVQNTVILNDGPRSGVPLILNEYNAVGPGVFLKDNGSDMFFGRIAENGGNWFELVVTQDHVNIQNWKLAWQEGTTTLKAGTITLTNHALWSDLRAGTIVTFTEKDSSSNGLDTDTSFDPALDDWWININTIKHGIPQTTYATTVTNVSGDGPGNFSVGNSNWQLTIKDASNAIIFGPAGEGIPPASGVGNDEVCKLEENPGPSITPSSNYKDGTSSTFGHPNQWSSGTITQDFSGLRAPATVVALVAVSTFDPASWGETHATFPNRDEVATLPASMTSFTAGQEFYVELWAQTLHPTGLAMVSTDVVFDAALLDVVGGTGFPFPADGIFHTTLFNTLPVGTVDNPNGRIEDLSGSYLPGVGCSTDPTGNEPRWARVAVIKMQASAAGTPRIMPTPTESAIYVIAHCGTSEIDPAQVDYRGINEGQGRLVLVPDPLPQLTQVGGPAVTVKLNVADLTVPINGVQALIHYNPTNLTLIGIAAAPPLWTEVAELNANGDIAFAAVINSNGGSTSANGTVATLTFTPAAESTPVVSFLGDYPPTYPALANKLTEAAHGLTISPSRTNTTDGDITILDGVTCLIGGTEYAEGALNPANACEKCDPAVHLTAWTPVANGTSCADGTVCNGAETCQSGTCTAGMPLNCDDSNVCTTDSCDAVTGCGHDNNSAACDDGNACTTSDTCANGSCVGGPAPDCNDGNLCTDDACDTGSGCVHVYNTAPCSDGNACTTNDACAGGVCVGGSALNCDDSNVCTDDSCNTTTGCLHSDNTVACDDGNACTTNDACAGGACVGGSPPNCSDDNACTVDSCDTALGCQHSNASVGTPCGDSSDSNCDNPDTCDGSGVCQSNHEANGLSCSDGVYCNGAETCQDGVCALGPPVPDCCEVDGDCDNHNVCDGGESCVSHTCVPGTQLDCNDSNPCTTDSCDPDDGCQHVDNTDPCSDGNACTTNDTCAAGVCVGGLAPNCDDSNVCTDDSCNPASGCVHTNNTVTCDDANACTTNDTCANGACVGGAPPDCSDGNVCTDDACTPASGCTHTNNAVSCNDGNACTTSDTCSAGSCVGGPPPDCNDGNVCTDDSCDMVLGCQHVNNTAPCSDGNVCNGVEMCQGGTCQAGTSLNCNDSNVCTDDTCDAVLGCHHTNNTAACDDGAYCTVNDICGNGTCAGTPRDCSDSDPCTADTCNEGTDQCVHTGSPHINVNLQVQALTAAVTRDVTFVITNCGGSTDTRTVGVSFTAGSGTAVLTAVDPNADFIQATEGHTLSETLPLVLVGGCEATANFTGEHLLLSGDFSNPTWVPKDNLVDITDFAILSIFWNKPVSPSLGWLADATGDGWQNVADFTAIQANFAKVGDPASQCSPLGLPNGPRVKTRIAVGDLPVPNAQYADRNGDGVVDTRDIRVFAAEKGLALTPKFRAQLDAVEAAEANEAITLPRAR